MKSPPKPRIQSIGVAGSSKFITSPYTCTPSARLNVSFSASATACSTVRGGSATPFSAKNSVL